MKTTLTESELIKSEDPTGKIELLESLNDHPLSEEQLDLICNLISDEDKGIRNAVSNLLIFNETPEIPQKIVPLISSPEISIRNFAGDILTKLGDKSADALLSYINERSDDDKKFIIDILGLINCKRAEEKILDVLSTADDDNIILSCIEALGNIKSEISIDVLMSFYTRNELYKAMIIEALGKIGSEEALGFILSKYEDEDELIKFTIIESLGLIGDEETFFFLLAELNEIKGPLIWPVIKAIYTLKEKFDFDIPFDERMRNAILQIIFEAEQEYKKIAAIMLSVFNDKEIISVFLKIIGDDPQTDEIILSKIIEIPQIFFELIGGFLKEHPLNLKSLLNLLNEVLRVHEHRVSSFTIPLLLRDITDSLCQLINDYDEEVRILSFELLFVVDPETALLFADDICEDQNYWNRFRLIEIIEESDMVQVQGVLKKLVNDPEEMVRDRASNCIIERSHK